jgi:hypothetical protein
VEKEAAAILGTLVGVIVIFTFMTGGSLGLGTSAAGPFFSLGFKGPSSKV